MTEVGQPDTGRGPTDGVAPQEPAARILIVEDHTMLAQALALGLELSGHRLQCRIATIPGPPSVLDQAADYRPCLTLLDLDLGEEDGLDLVRGLRATGTKVLIITGSHDRQRLAATLSLGTEGWVSKDQPFEQLVEGALQIIAGRRLLAPSLHDELATLGRSHLEDFAQLRGRIESLSRREQEVLVELCRGKGAGEISRELFLSLATVRSHIRAILLKLGVPSQLAAVSLVQRAGIRLPTGESLSTRRGA